ncbi:MAG: exodeoxyribonuclease VII large subunit [Deltaproteobacteria bacterium]|nr:exodeoxyribonuclease VII large subunit [Deltaproteobacteria bacterium]
MAPDRKSFSVTELTRNIKSLLEDCFGSIVVTGEISNLSRPASGHLYFNLKDEKSQIAAVIFRGQASKIPFDLENGMEVLLLGRVSVYEPRGTYQIIAESAEPLGVGSLQLAFDQLKVKLEKEGLFDPALKKPLPRYPKKIGIITSPTGAAIQDMLKVLNRRWPGLEILIDPVSVQGESSSFEIAKAIDRLQGYPELDLIILGRGGGSIEDLWAFNEERVARAVFKSKIPIISAVGHETDFTICDFTADLRAPTPSAAAELAVPVKSELIERTGYLKRRLEQLLQNQLEARFEKIGHIKKRLSNPRWFIENQTLRLDELTNRINQSMKNETTRLGQLFSGLSQRLLAASPGNLVAKRLNQSGEFRRRLTQAMEFLMSGKKQSLGEKIHLLESLSPLSVLKRGYALTTDMDQSVVYSIDQLQTGQEIKSLLRDGEIRSVVKSLRPKAVSSKDMNQT